MKPAVFSNHLYNQPPHAATVWEQYREALTTTSLPNVTCDWQSFIKQPEHHFMPTLKQLIKYYCHTTLQFCVFYLLCPLPQEGLFDIPQAKIHAEVRKDRYHHKLQRQMTQQEGP